MISSTFVFALLNTSPAEQTVDVDFTDVFFDQVPSSHLSHVHTKFDLIVTDGQPLGLLPPCTRTVILCCQDASDAWWVKRYVYDAIDGELRKTIIKDAHYETGYHSPLPTSPALSSTLVRPE